MRRGFSLGLWGRCVAASAQTTAWRIISPTRTAASCVNAFACDPACPGFSTRYVPLSALPSSLRFWQNCKFWGVGLVGILEFVTFFLTC